ncbi:unnamed protein product [Discula destructiva]
MPGRTRIITLKVAPDKLQAILERRPNPASRALCVPLASLNPHAATPPTPIARRSNRARQITAVAAASGAQGNRLYTNATLAASLSDLSSVPSSPQIQPSLAIATSTSTQASTTSIIHTPASEDSSLDLEEDDGDIAMAEKDAQKQSAAGAGAATANGEAGAPYYEEQRKHLQQLLEKKRKLAESLANREEAIERKEAEYLDSTPAGNILMGFDNYTKGSTQAAAAQRRKGVNPDQYRVFSRSSVTYNPLAAAGLESGANTPGSSHAPTPVSSTFGGSNHPTPTTTTGGGGARASGGAAQRDRKKKGVVAETGDSESDAREVKKVRTTFGASRK